MNYIGGGIHGATTKKALKEAVKADPNSVEFYSTGMMGPQFNGKVSNMPENSSLTVAGPDPFNARNWFASIERNSKGVIVVR